MSKAIATFGTGSHAELLEIALPSFRAFAQKHGYKLFVTDEIGKARPASWYKVQMIRQLLAEHEAVLWIDADVVIVDGREDWDVPPEAWQALVKHQTGDGDVPNHGIWYARRAMTPWLEKIWDQRQYLHHGWWEQAAAMYLMGYEPDRRPCSMGNPSELYTHTHFVDCGWNVHKWDRNQSERPRFMHATMYPDRVGVMKGWAEEAKQWYS